MGVDEFLKKAEFWFYDVWFKSAQKKDSVAVVSLEKHWELNAKRNPQLDQGGLTGSWAALYHNLGEKEKAF